MEPLVNRRVGNADWLFDHRIAHIQVFDGRKAVNHCLQTDCIGIISRQSADIASAEVSDVPSLVCADMGFESANIDTAIIKVEKRIEFIG